MTSNILSVPKMHEPPPTPSLTSQCSPLGSTLHLRNIYWPGCPSTPQSLLCFYAFVPLSPYIWKTFLWCFLWLIPSLQGTTQASLPFCIPTPILRIELGALFSSQCLPLLWYLSHGIITVGCLSFFPHVRSMTMLYLFFQSHVVDITGIQNIVE